MKRKNTRPTNGGRAGKGNSTRNVRSIDNSREVSRRNKGKDRYTGEENRSRKRNYYDEEVRSNRAKTKKKTSDPRMKKQSKKNSKGKVRRRGKRQYMFSKSLGIAMAIAQFVLSVILVVNIMFFDMLSSTYIMVLSAVLLILLGITLLSQIGAKKRGILGKIFCLILCVALAMGSIYLGRVNSALHQITDGNTKKSSIAVAVLKSNHAEKLSDIKNDTFGIQYVTNGDQMKSALKMVNEEIGQEPKVQEYNSIIEEVNGLYNKDVQAIVYNTSHTSIITEQIPTFKDDIKIIYTHDIIVEIENEAVDVSVTEPFTIYLSGIDVYGDITQQSRSDVNIVAIVNPESHQVLLITTPRDYFVPIPGISGGQRDKLTHAGIYGVDASMNTLSEVYDVDIPFYGRVNFTSMIDIVDALGGLDVESDEEFDTGYEAGCEFHVNLGMNHFNGEQALAFCRERKSLPDGDNARGRHQQAVITAIIQKMMSPAMLRGAMDIINTVSSGVDTNFSMDQIQALVKTQLKTGGAWNIYSVSAEGEGDKRSCYSSGDTPLYVTIPNEQSVINIQDLIDRVLAGEVIDGSVVAQQ